MSAPKLAGVRQPGLHQAGKQIGGGGGGGSSAAVDITITDAGAHFASGNVEGALQEDGAAIALRPLTTDLASHANGKGASTIGFEDPANNFGNIVALGGTKTVEAGLELIYGWISDIWDSDVADEAAIALRPLTTDLASTAAAKGASTVGIQDVGALITATTVEGALAELAGTTPLTRGGTGQITAAAAYDALTIKAPDIASAATINLSLAGCPGHYAVITGATGPVTSLGTAPAGVARVLRFASTPTLTHNATSLILPGGANIVAAAGDVMFVHSLGSGNWRCTSYMRAASLAALATDLASTSAAKGASLIGIQDAGALITATTVEGALAEIATTAGTGVTHADLISQAGGLGAALVGFNDSAVVVPAIYGATVQDAISYLAGSRPLSTDLASTSASVGASLIGIQDAGGLITATTVEGALAELAGAPKLVQGTLTDAAATIAVGTASEFTLPAATLTANRILTLSTTGAVAGEVLRVIRRDATAFTYAVVNGGAGGGTMYTFVVSVARVADFQYDGTNWAMAGHSRIS